MVRVLASIALAVLIATPGLAAAQPDDAPPDGEPPARDPKEARRWMDAGDTLVKKGDQLARRGKTADAQSQYERALLSYQNALEASGNPQLYYAIAVAEEKLGKNREALLHFRKVTLEVKGNSHLLELAMQRLGALSMAYGLFTATIDPEGAALALDGKPVGTSPLPEPLVLDPGNYTLTITADGYQPLDVKLGIEGGSESERTFKLDPVPVVFEKPVDAPRPVPKRKPPPRPSKLLVWVGLGATVALVGVGSTAGVIAVQRHQTFEDLTATDVEREDARTSGKRLSLVADLCLLGAAITAGFTTYYYLGVYKPKLRKRQRQMEAQPKVAVSPWVQPSIGGITIAVTY